MSRQKEAADRRLGYEFKCASSVGRGDASGLRAALADGVIDLGSVVYYLATGLPPAQMPWSVW